MSPVKCPFYSYIYVFCEMGIQLRSCHMLNVHTAAMFMTL